MPRFCPRCLGTDIEKDLSFMSYGAGTYFNSYTCKTCGYSGTFFPEASAEDLEKMRHLKS